MSSLVWQPIDSKIHKALEMVLESWKGTPFREGLATKGAGADCIRFTTSALDELYRRPPTKIPRLSPDASTHNLIGVRSLITFLKDKYPSDCIKNNILNPGDIVTEKRGFMAGHTLLVGPEKNTLWHSINGVGVCKTGFGSLSNICHLERPKDKNSWVHCLE